MTGPIGGVRRWIEVWIWVLLAGGLAVGLSGFQVAPFERADAAEYLSLARGDVGAVMQPFASRPLGPMVARRIAVMVGRPVEWGFRVQGLVSLTVVLGVVFGVLVRAGGPRGALGMVAVAPFWSELYGGLALPDLWYAGLMAGLVWLLRREWWVAAGAMFLPLMMSREATWIGLGCLLVAGWGRVSWRGLGLAVYGCFIGAIKVQRLAAGSLGNSEGLPQMVYLLAKMPWNFAKNVLGLQPWAARYGYETCAVPAWSHGSHWGAVGFCAFAADGPLTTLHDCLLTFGVLPVVALVGMRGWRMWPVWIRFAVIFGGVSLVLGPLLGAKVYRLVGYGWPLVVLAGPYLVKRVGWWLVAVQVGVSLGLVWVGTGWADVGLVVGWGLAGVGVWREHSAGDETGNRQSAIGNRDK